MLLSISEFIIFHTFRTYYSIPFSLPVFHVNISFRTISMGNHLPADRTIANQLIFFFFPSLSHSLTHSINHYFHTHMFPFNHWPPWLLPSRNLSTPLQYVYRMPFERIFRCTSASWDMRMTLDPFGWWMMPSLWRGDTSLGAAHASTNPVRRPRPTPPPQQRPHLPLALQSPRRVVSIQIPPLRLDQGDREARPQREEVATGRLVGVLALVMARLHSKDVLDRWSVCF